MYFKGRGILRGMKFIERKAAKVPKSRMAGSLSARTLCCRRQQRSRQSRGIAQYEGEPLCAFHLICAETQNQDLRGLPHCLLRCVAHADPEWTPADAPCALQRSSTSQTRRRAARRSWRLTMTASCESSLAWLSWIVRTPKDAARSAAVVFASSPGVRASDVVFAGQSCSTARR